MFHTITILLVPVLNYIVLHEKNVASIVSFTMFTVYVTDMTDYSCY